MKWPKNLRFSAAVERSIMTPHAHEDGACLTYEEKKLVGLGHNEPLWLIWTVRTHRGTDVPQFPVLDTVCDSEYSVRYHVMMVTEEAARAKQNGDVLDFYVERIPANHRFGSTVPELQMRTLMGFKTHWKTRKQLDGD